MANINREDVVFYLSTATTESPYGTADAVDRQIIPDGAPLPMHVPTIDTNESQATGSEGPTESQLLMELYRWSPTIKYVHADDVAIFLSLVCGAPSSEAADTSAFLHEFSLSSSHTLPSCSLEYYKATGVQRLLAGGACGQLGMNFTANQFASLSPQMYFASDAAGVGSAALTAETAVMNGANYTMSIGAAAEGTFTPGLGADDITSPADISADFVSLEYTITPFTDPRSAMFDARSTAPVMAERGPYGLRLRLTIETDDQTEIDYILDQDDKALEFEWDSGVLAGTATQNYGLQFVFPQVRFMAHGDSWDQNGRLRQAFDLMLFEDATLGRMQAAVWNKTEAYFA